MGRPEDESQSTDTSPRSILDATMDSLRRAAEHVETERAVAEALQRSLLPERQPDLPGLQIAFRYEAGSDEIAIGGDWFDLIPLRDGRVGLVIGDVAGRGVRAAAKMAQLQSALRAYALEGLRPSLALERLNNFVREAEGGGMVTVLYAVLDPQDGSLEFASAGHLPPLLIDAEGSASYLEGPAGRPLGVGGTADYDDSITALSPGSTLLLYTDGLVERPSEPLEQGLERLIEKLGGQRVTPQQLCDELIGSMAAPDGRKDDVAVLVVQLDPEQGTGSELRLKLPAETRSLAPMRHNLTRWLRAAGAGDGETYEILVACGEAAANAIAHAYPAGDAAFELRAAPERGGVFVSVRDQGQWRPPRRESRGRGLTLIGELMDEVEFDRDEHGTTVRMWRALGAEVGAR